MPQLFDDLFYIAPDVGDEQRTVAAAIALADLLNSHGNAEGIVFATTFIPEFDPDKLPAPKGLIFPAGVTIEKTARRGHTEDNSIQIGIGRKISNEDTDPKRQVKTVEEIVDIIKAEENRVLTVGDSEVTYLSIEVALFIPEQLRKRVALSVISYVFRGFS